MREVATKLKFYIMWSELTLQILVFTLHGLQLIQSLLIRVFHFEQFSAKGTGLLLCTFKL